MYQKSKPRRATLKCQIICKIHRRITESWFTAGWILSFLLQWTWHWTVQPWAWSWGESGVMGCFPGSSVSKESACSVRDPGLTGSGRSLEKGMAATHCSILAWRIPWTEESGGLQSLGLQRVGRDWATNTHTVCPLGSWWQGKGEKRAEQRASINRHPGEGPAMNFEVLRAKWKCGAPCSKNVLALWRQWQGTERSLGPFFVWVLRQSHNSHTQEASPDLDRGRRSMDKAVSVKHRAPPLIRHWPDELFLRLPFSRLENPSLENERLGSYQTKLSDYLLNFSCIKYHTHKNRKESRGQIKGQILIALCFNPVKFLSCCLRRNL